MPSEMMKTLPMKIAVFGANGTTGKHIVEALTKRGHSVVAAVRRPETIKTSNQVTVTKIDLEKMVTLTDAISDCDAVVSAIGSRSSTSGQPSTHSVYSSSVRAIREAMRLCSVRRIIVLSCDGVEDDGEGPRFISNLRRRIGMNRFLEMARMETVLEETPDLDWTVVRLTTLVDVKRRPYLVENRVLDRGSFKISYLDAADFICTEIEENKWVRMFPVLGYSWASF